MKFSVPFRTGSAAGFRVLQCQLVTIGFIQHTGRREGGFSVFPIHRSILFLAALNWIAFEPTIYFAKLVIHYHYHATAAIGS